MATATRFTIGEFSRLARVPVKTLRYYDEIGLFAPAEVDPFNGYRRYFAAQLSRLNRILALKGLGFGLADISRLLEADLGAAELRDLLRRRRAELERERGTADRRIADVQIRLRQIEQELSMTPIDILTKTLPPVAVAGAREVVADPALMRERCMALNDRACDLISAAGAGATGPSMALYYPCEDAIDVEMAYPVGGATTGEGLHVLPAAEVAYAIYTGSYDDFGAVGRLHVALREWVAAQGLESAEPVRELYLQPPGPEGPSGVMELQYPLAPASDSARR